MQKPLFMDTGALLLNYAPMVFLLTIRKYNGKGRWADKVFIEHFLRTLKQEALPI